MLTTKRSSDGSRTAMTCFVLVRAIDPRNGGMLACGSLRLLQRRYIWSVGRADPVPETFTVVQVFRSTKSTRIHSLQLPDLVLRLRRGQGSKKSPETPRLETSTR